MHLAVLTLFQQVPLLIRVDGLILVLIGIKLKKSISVKRGIKKKPIFTYGFCRQRAHFEICKNNIIPYYSYKDLNSKILNFNKYKKHNSNNLKNELSEKNTIKIFKKILLNKKQKKPSVNIIDYIMVFFFFFQRNYFYLRHKIYINFYKIFK